MWQAQVAGTRGSQVQRVLTFRVATALRGAWQGRCAAA